MSESNEIYKNGYSVSAIVELYVSGKTLKEVSKITGVSHKTIKKMVVNSGNVLRKTTYSLEEKIAIMENNGINSMWMIENYKNFKLSKNKLSVLINDRTKQQITNRRNLEPILAHYGIFDTDFTERLYGEGLTAVEVVELYKSGKTIYQIQLEHGVSHTITTRCLREAGVKARTKKKVVDVINSLSLEGISSEVIYQKYVIDNLTTREVLEWLEINSNEKITPKTLSNIISVLNIDKKHDRKEINKRKKIEEQKLRRNSKKAVTLQDLVVILKNNSIDDSLVQQKYSELDAKGFNKWLSKVSEKKVPHSVYLEFVRTRNIKRFAKNSLVKREDKRSQIMLSEWDYEKNKHEDIRCISVFSKSKFWWRCVRGHSWSASMANRYGLLADCHVCTGRKVIPGYNDLASYSLPILNEWDYEINTHVAPTEVSISSSKKVWWKCKENHRWQAQISNRTKSNNPTGCPECAGKNVSQKEIEMATYIENILPKGCQIIRNSREIIPPKEIDLYIPQKKIAVEFNGLYWHSEQFEKDKNYHYNKWKKCQEQGIQLITVWEDDWRDKRDVVKKILAHKLGVSQSKKIGARKTYVDSSVPFREVSEVLNKSHIQGETAGSHYLGLRTKENDELVAVMVLRSSSTDMDTFELLRYGTVQSVQGGFTKLVDFVHKELNAKRIFTFSDNEISDGGLYSKHGFVKIKELNPDYKYIHQSTRKHKFLFRKSRFKANSNLVYEKGLTERELATLNGLYRVYDSGKVKWELTF